MAESSPLPAALARSSGLEAGSPEARAFLHNLVVAWAAGPGRQLDTASDVAEQVTWLGIAVSSWPATSCLWRRKEERFEKGL